MNRLDLARPHSRRTRSDPPHHASALSTNSASIHLVQVRLHDAVNVERSRVHSVRAVRDGRGGLASLPRLRWMCHSSCETWRASSRQLAAGWQPERPWRARSQWADGSDGGARGLVHGGSAPSSTHHHGAWTPIFVWKE